jgi:hypothetical protein
VDEDFKYYVAAWVVALLICLVLAIAALRQFFIGIITALVSIIAIVSCG